MLADYIAPHREIHLGGTSFSVSGVSFNGVSQLLSTHFDDLDALIKLVKNASEGKLDNIEQGDIEQVALATIADAPGFVANLIAVAAGEATESAVRAAASIPAPKQVEILMEVVKLTFEEVGGVKKGMGAIMRLLAKTKPTSQ